MLPLKNHVASWAMKKTECRRIDVFELCCWRRLLVSKEIKPVNPKENQPWIFIGRTDAEAEVPICWPPAAKRWLIGKNPNTGKDWGQEEKRAADDEMVRWHNRLIGHEFDQTLGDSKGQGNLVCCSPWDRR